MNNIVIGVLALAAITVIFLAIRLSVCKVKCKCKDKNPKDTQELIENAGKIVETLPPVDGPDAPPSVDHDNPYTITKNEPLVIADKDELETLAEDIGQQNFTAVPCTPKIDAFSTYVDDNVTDDDMKKVAAAITPKKRGRKKATDTKPKAKAEKKTAKKAEKKVEKKTEKKPAKRARKKKETA